MSAASAPALKAPFPYFGGKSAIAPRVWELLGNVPNYVEPFCGSCAVLLARPHKPSIETVNDADGLLCNFWRAVQSDPDAVARHADWIIHECDLHARHSWLVGQKSELQTRLEGDPDFYDAKAAGWWLYGICLWIGSGWCSGKGPWQPVEMEDGSRQLVHLGDAGMGVNRKRVHLGNAGRGQCEEWSEHIRETMAALSDRLRRVRICCGDWSRVCGPTPTVKNGLTGVFLDPPYSHDERSDTLYAHEMKTAVAVREWAVQWGDDPRMRIVLCGYDGEHALPSSWREVPWHARGGYGSQGNGSGAANRKRERIWASPHCLGRDLFSEAFHAE